MSPRSFILRTLWVSVIAVAGWSYLAFSRGHGAALLAWGLLLAALAVAGGLALRPNFGSGNPPSSRLPLVVQAACVLALLAGGAALLALEPVARAEPLSRVVAAWPLLALFPDFFRGMGRRIRNRKPTAPLDPPGARSTSA